ncbi:MAG: septum formation initiator family protein [Erysipelotrichaceae bacterium]|nr:septum formation initiator family protein [Erysipelotrichaceae bacterium]
MAASEKRNQRKEKKRSPLKKMISVAVIMVACFLTYSAGEELMTTLQLHKDIQETQAEIDALKEKQAELETEKSNLEDPEYVKRYARGKYMLSKDGEQVLKLPAKEE